MESNAGERIAGALIEDEAESSSKTDGEEDDPRADDASDSSGMSIEEDECARHPHSVTSPLVARSRMRPTPVASDDEEAEEELEVQEILETPVDDEQDLESSAGKGEAESFEDGESESSEEEEEDEGERPAVDDTSSQAEPVRRLCVAMLEAAAASELASKSTLSRAMLAGASEAEDTSIEATEELTGEVEEPTGKIDEPICEADDPQSPSSPSEPDDLTIAMAELQESTALFDAAMQRLRDAERAASHPCARASARATPSTASTTGSDFEDTLGDAIAAAASAADLASLAIHRRA